MSSPDDRTQTSLALVVCILVLASGTSIMSTDMYVPSLPDLTKIFSTTPEMVKLTVSLNMLAFGLAQFFYGPLSDRFGRKPVLLCSIASVVVLCFVITQVNTIEQLIVARILLGLAAAAEAVLGLAIIKDLYTEKQQVKVLATLNTVIAIAPAIAPIIGGYIHVRYGWSMNFYVLTAMAMISFITALTYLPESHTPDPTALKPIRVLRGYTRLFSNAEFMVHTALCGGAIVVAFFIGSLMASKAVERIDTDVMLSTGVFCILLGSAFLIVVILFTEITPVSIVICYSVMTFGMAGGFAVAPSRALRSVSSQTGSASSMLVGVEQTTAGLAAVAVSVFHDGTAKPMAWITVALAILVVPFMRASRRQNRAHRQKDVQ